MVIQILLKNEVSLHLQTMLKFNRYKISSLYRGTSARIDRLDRSDTGGLTKVCACCTEWVRIPEGHTPTAPPSQSPSPKRRHPNWDASNVASDQAICLLVWSYSIKRSSTFDYMYLFLPDYDKAKRKGNCFVWVLVLITDEISILSVFSLYVELYIPP